MHEFLSNILKLQNFCRLVDYLIVETIEVGIGRFEVGMAEHLRYDFARDFIVLQGHCHCMTAYTAGQMIVDTEFFDQRFQIFLIFGVTASDVVV